MSSPIANAYGSPTTLTITLASLASGAARQSAAIAVSGLSPIPGDILVTVKVKTGTVSSSTGIWVYAAGSTDGGTTYTEGATGSDAAITLISPTNLRLLGVINAPSSASTYVGGPFSIAAAFGGTLPANVSLVVVDNTGGALDSSGANHSVTYQAVSETVG